MFLSADSSGAGSLDRKGFTSALQQLSDRHRLGLTSDYILRLFREADKDYSGRVDYNKFLSAFQTGGSHENGPGAYQSFPSKLPGCSTCGVLICRQLRSCDSSVV